MQAEIHVIKCWYQVDVAIMLLLKSDVYTDVQSNPTLCMGIMGMYLPYVWPHNIMLCKIIDSH